jgi:hypothetical protein
LYFGYDITKRNASPLRKCRSLYWVGNIKLFVFTHYDYQWIKCKYAMFSVKWFRNFCFSILISFIYFNMELLRKDSIPFILWSWHHPWSACLHYWQMHIVCEHCKWSGSFGIVSKTNLWILILHIFMHLTSQGCKFYTVYWWCDSHWNVGNANVMKDRR